MLKKPFFTCLFIALLGAGLTANASADTEGKTMEDSQFSGTISTNQQNQSHLKNHKKYGSIEYMTAEKRFRTPYGFRTKQILEPAQDVFRNNEDKNSSQ